MDDLFRNSRRKLSQGLLFWREVGRGTPIIFLHGAWNDSSQWVSVMELLSNKCQCFAPDLLGIGESEAPEIHYSIDLQAEMLGEFLQALKLERVFLVGHSLGAWVATTYARKYPLRVSGMILISPEGVETEHSVRRCQKMQGLLKRPLLVFGLLRLLRPLAKKLGWKINPEADLKQRELMEEYPTATQLLYTRQTPEILAEMINEHLSGMDVPTLILQASKDVPEVIEMSQVYARLGFKASLKMIADVGNDLPSTSVGLVSREIRDFVTGESLQHS